MTREEASLAHILIAIASEERGSGLRNYADNWFAYRMGGPFLTKGGNPHWFNNPSPARHREALLKMQFVSKSAKLVVRGQNDERLIVDHAIPLRQLRVMLVEHRPKDISAVRQFLLNHYHVGVITKAEDVRLNALGLNSKMPDGWTRTDSPFARYEEAEILVCEQT